MSTGINGSIPLRCASPSPSSDADSSADSSQDMPSTATLHNSAIAGIRLRSFGVFLSTLMLTALPLESLRCSQWRMTPYRCSFIGYSQVKNNIWPSSRLTSELRASKIDDILEDLKSLTLLETSELVKKIEETFGVSASMAVSAAPAAAPAAVAVPEDDDDDEDKPKKTSFEVVLLERPEEQTVRMALFRMLRKVMPDKPLTEVKAAIDNAPTTLKVCSREEEAKEALKIIEGAGGKAEIR
ncbi:ribosomal protein L12 [Babesia ovis]|uniref:Ribosomal protein L12 n=1 Tax=Babesia ovis TaxID=5869 RepID=A0A9W5T7W7_BABOV|nr:ribosomal protein L12 [Babesia ovis]